MPRINSPVYSLNGGEVGKDAIARFDLDRLRYAAVLQENFLPHVIGKMQLRPGFESLVEYNPGIRMVPFIVNASESQMLVFSPNRMEILSDGEYLTRQAVSTTIQNGGFASFAGWSDESTGGASAGVSGGNLVLTGSSGSFAIARQAISVSAPDQTVEHGLRVNVVNGPVQVRIGSTAGGSDIFGPSFLEEGSHSLGITPGSGVGTIYIDLFTEEFRNILVDSVFFEGALPIIVDTPWLADDLASIRYDQSQDVIFVASDGYQQRRIERRGPTSFSVVRYKTSDGPFQISPERTVTIAPSVTRGVGTLTASESTFSEADVGSLIRLTHNRQLTEDTFTAAGQSSNSIRVVGVGDSQRGFTVNVSGTFTGTIVLEQSIGDEGFWTTFATYTGPVSGPGTDGLDNQIVFYRLRADAISSGSADVSLIYSGGSTSGVSRVTSFTSDTVVDIEIMEPFGSTEATVVWDLGEWSDRNGWPDTVALHDGRLFWGRGDLVFGSESDRFNSFSDQSEGDAAPIIRSIGASSQQGIVWLQSLQRLVAGSDGSEISIRASSFGEPLTAAAFVPRRASTRGCADIAAVEIDTSAIFVQRSGSRIFDMVLDGGAQDYVSRDVTELHTEICNPGVVSIAVQRQPDTRIWFVLSDGSVRCLTYEPSENVLAWSRVVTDGFVEDVEVLPSVLEDEVYIAVNRNIAGSTQRRIERLARSDEARGGTTNKMADSFVHVTNDPASVTVSGLDHLNGESVIVWADGVAVHDQSNTVTVSGGQITLAEAASSITVGIPYSGRWRSTKLAYGAAGGTALGMYKKVDHLGMYLVDTVLQGIRIGREFSSLFGFSRTDRGRPLDFSTTQSEFDVDLQQFNGEWDVDSRICIEVQAPYPASVAALVIAMKTNDR